MQQKPGRSLTGSLPTGLTGPQQHRPASLSAGSTMVSPSQPATSLHRASTAPAGGAPCTDRITGPQPVDVSPYPYTCMHQHTASYAYNVIYSNLQQQHTPPRIVDPLVSIARFDYLFPNPPPASPASPASLASPTCLANPVVSLARSVSLASPVSLTSPTSPSLSPTRFFRNQRSRRPIISTPIKNVRCYSFFFYFIY